MSIRFLNHLGGKIKAKKHHFFNQEISLLKAMIVWALNHKLLLLHFCLHSDVHTILWLLSLSRIKTNSNAKLYLKTHD